MITAQLPTEQRFVLADVNWPTYVGIADLVGARPVRVTYDGRNIELMTLSSEHERHKELMGRLINTISDETDVEIANFGSMTFRREDMERGLEPDKCYGIQNEPAVRARSVISLDVDLPPDLAMEVEIGRSALDRMGIYGRLKVPEVWRWNGERFR